MSGLHSKKITCDGSLHTLATALGGSVQAKWFQFLADPSNGTAVSIGGPDVDTNGFPLVGGAAQQLTPNGAEPFNFYDSSQIYYDGANGTVFYVLYPIG